MHRGRDGCRAPATVSRSRRTPSVSSVSTVSTVDDFPEAAGTPVRSRTRTPERGLAAWRDGRREGHPDVPARLMADSTPRRAHYAAVASIIPPAASALSSPERSQRNLSLPQGACWARVTCSCSASLVDFRDALVPLGALRVHVDNPAAARSLNVGGRNVGCDIATALALFPSRSAARKAAAALVDGTATNPAVQRLSCPTLSLLSLDTLRTAAYLDRSFQDCMPSHNSSSQGESSLTGPSASSAPPTPASAPPTPARIDSTPQSARRANRPTYAPKPRETALTFDDDDDDDGDMDSSNARDVELACRMSIDAAASRGLEGSRSCLQLAAAMLPNRPVTPRVLKAVVAPFRALMCSDGPIPTAVGTHLAIQWLTSVPTCDPLALAQQVFLQTAPTPGSNMAVTVHGMAFAADVMQGFATTHWETDSAAGLLICSAVASLARQRVPRTDAADVERFIAAQRRLAAATFGMSCVQRALDWVGAQRIATIGRVSANDRDAKGRTVCVIFTANSAAHTTMGELIGWMRSQRCILDRIEVSGVASDANRTHVTVLAELSCKDDAQRLMASVKQAECIMFERCRVCLCSQPLLSRAFESVARSPAEALFCRTAAGEVKFEQLVEAAAARGIWIRPMLVDVEWADTTVAQYAAGSAAAV